MDIQAAIKAVIARQDLSSDEMNSVMQQIMTGECTASQIGGFLVGLHMKGETVDEISAAARVMRDLSTRVEVIWSIPLVREVIHPVVSISRLQAQSWRRRQAQRLPSMVIVP